MKRLNAPDGYQAAIVFLFATLLRWSMGWLMIGKLNADPDAYRAISDCLRTTGVYGLVGQEGIGVPTAFRPPLYPVILAWLPSTPSAVLLLHSLLGGWTVSMTFFATEAFLGHRAFKVSDGKVSDSKLFRLDWAPFFAAAIVLIDPILLNQSTLVMTETLAAAISANVFWWCARLPPVCDSRFTESTVSVRWAGCLGVMMTLGLSVPTDVLGLVGTVVGGAGVSLGHPRSDKSRSQRSGVDRFAFDLDDGCRRLDAS